MEPTADEAVDLIDDLWCRIFNGLDCKLRASLFQVCKRWKAVASNPRCWTTLDVEFHTQSEPRLSKIVASFCQFITNYCSMATHVCITKKDAYHFWTILMTLFPLRQLRYLKISVDSRDYRARQTFGSATFPKPDWSNLIYLNLNLPPYNISIDGQQWERLTEGAPNLEELYLSCTAVAMGNQTALLNGLQNLQKLKILYADWHQSIDNETIVKHVPQLQTIISTKSQNDQGGNFFNQPMFRGPIPFGGPPQPVGTQNQSNGPKYIGSTLAISCDMLRSRDLEIVKKFGHLLSKSNYAFYFSEQLATIDPPAPLSVPLLHYLFKELKLDINCCTTRRSDPFAVDLVPALLPPVAWYPLNTVLDDVELVRILLDFGADPNYPAEGDSPLGFHKTSKESCILLLEYGADPLKKVEGLAVMRRWFDMYSDAELMDVLLVALNKGLDINQILDGSDTILDLAITRRHKRTAQELLKLGARWTPPSMDKLILWDSNWWSEVIQRGDFDVSQLLLSTALTAVKLRLYPMVRKFLQDFPRDLDEQNSFSLTHYISLLLQSNTYGLNRKVNHKKEGFGFGARPTTASKKSFEEVKIESSSTEWQLLGQMITELNLDVNMKTSTGKTPLLLVCESENQVEAFLKILIEMGANVNEPDLNGWTPLHAACFGGHYSTMQLLLSHGANINAQDKLGLTPIMARVLSSHHGDLSDFIAVDFDVTLKDKYTHRSILHFLAAVGAYQEIALLLDKKPELDINCRDVHGFTPLHYAAKIGHNDTMKLLVERGADVNAMSDTLALTPIAVYLAKHNPKHPYHQYIETYMNIEATTGHVIDVYVGAKEVGSLCKLTLAPWTVVGGINNGRVFRSSPPTSGDNHFLPWPTNLSLNDPFGNNLLHILVRTHCVASLIKEEPEFAEFHKLWSKPNKRGTTPFHLFAMDNQLSQFDKNNEIEFVNNFLISQQRELLYSFNNKDEHGKTALDYFFCHSSVHQIAATLDEIQGINFMSPSVYSQPTSLLHSAVSGATLTKTLLMRVATMDPDALNMKINGKTPFMIYIEKLLTDNFNEQQSALLDCFLECKVDLNAQDNEGNTALHYACYFFHLGAWDYYMQSNALEESSVFSVTLFKLLEGGARVDIKNNEGQAPIDILPNLLQLDRSLVRLVEEQKRDKT